MCQRHCPGRPSLRHRLVATGPSCLRRGRPPYPRRPAGRCRFCCPRGRVGLQLGRSIRFGQAAAQRRVVAGQLLGWWRRRLTRLRLAAWRHLLRVAAGPPPQSADRWPAFVLARPGRSRPGPRAPRKRRGDASHKCGTVRLAKSIAAVPKICWPTRRPRAINARQPSPLGRPIVGRVTGLLNPLAIWPPTCRVDAMLRLLFA